VSIAQSPKAKGSISEADKRDFQKELLAFLDDRNRGPSRSPIVLKLTFNTSHDNPPAIHTLAKNYLDLLERPIDKSLTKRRRLLYNNDRQVKVLIVEYRLDSKKEDGSIYVEATSLHSLLMDLQLYERILRNDFFDSRNYGRHYREYSFHFKETDKLDADDEDLDRLREFTRSKDSFIAFAGEATYNALLETYIRNAQKWILRVNRFSLDNLAGLFDLLKFQVTAYGAMNRQFEDLIKTSRDMALSPWLTLDLGVLPSHEGESKIFKEMVRRKLESYRIKHALLFPLRTMLSITILLLPPLDQGIDLDNLARKIIPFINDVLQPPATFLHSINIKDMPEGEIKAHLLSEREELKKLPKYSISRYQIIEIPRMSADPANGFIKMFLEDGFELDDIWDNLDQRLDEWSEYVGQMR
jgi:hypothetical protein